MLNNLIKHCKDVMPYLSLGPGKLLLLQFFFKVLTTLGYLKVFFWLVLKILESLSLSRVYCIKHDSNN